MDEEEALELLVGLLTAGGQAFTPCVDTALHLKRKGFVVVGRLGDEPRSLTEDELEYIIARNGGHIQ